MERIKSILYKTVVDDEDACVEDASEMGFYGHLIFS
jgi:hypothetical protein